MHEKRYLRLHAKIAIEQIRNLFQVTNVVLEEHYVIAGVVAVCDPGSIPINSRGEKQRMHLRDAFLQDRLDPIYVAYNM